MSSAELHAHLQTGATHVCQCWCVTRTDGLQLGFTDHDRPLVFEGVSFTPSSGLSARALASTSGLSVNNTEALGVLSSDAITEADIAAGRYDRAGVTVWQVCWDDVSARQIRFRGTMGEITRAAGGFQAELLGLTEALNHPHGRSYLKTCSAILGDAACGFNVSDPAFQTTFALGETTDRQHFRLPDSGDFADGWFTHGLLEVQSGDAAGLRGAIRSDVSSGGLRQIALWAPLPHPLAIGDVLRLTAGCDKRADTCREKFANLVNFQGFPDIPGDDWLVSVPRSANPNTGGSLTR